MFCTNIFLKCLAGTFSIHKLWDEKQMMLLNHVSNMNCQKFVYMCKYLTGKQSHENDSGEVLEAGSHKL